MKTYHIYTDGACSGNPGPGGCAAIIVDENNKEIDRISKGFERTTNNRMEMWSVVIALRYMNYVCKKQKIDLKEVSIVINSDSQLVVNTMNLGWSKKSNTDLWEFIDSDIAKFRNVSFVKVKGHADDYFNNEADKAAVEASKSDNKLTDHVYENLKEQLKNKETEPTLFPEHRLCVTEIRLNGVNAERGRSVTVVFSNNKETVLTGYNDGVVFSDVSKKEAMLLPDYVVRFGNWLNGGEL